MSNVTEENLLRDQLLQCADLSLRRSLQNTIGSAALANMKVTGMMTEIEKAAVERQSDLLNKVRLMDAKQECEEAVRTFVARLRSLANFCALSMVCAKVGCAQDMSYAEPSILLALVKGLYDGDTKSEVLSKVVQMNLEDTVAFVEAREIGRRDVQSLGGGPSSSQVNTVLIHGRCWRCNQEGHSGRAQAHIR